MTETVPLPDVPKKKRNRRKAKPARKKDFNLAAWIPLLVAIVGGLFAYKPLEKWMDSKLNSTPTPAPTVTLAAPMPILSTADDLPSPSAEGVILPTPLPSAIPTITATLDPSVAEKVFLKYSVSRTSGKIPLIVTINASESTFQRGDGSIDFCNKTKSCMFTFRVTHDGAQWIEPLTTKEGKFSYTFQKHGTYLISIVVCRDGICSADQITITAN